MVLAARPPREVPALHARLFVVASALVGCGAFGAFGAAPAPSESDAGETDASTGDSAIVQVFDESGAEAESSTPSCVLGCGDTQVTCRSYDFVKKCPAPRGASHDADEWYVDGDPPPNAVTTCAAGSVRVAARYTADAVLQLDRDTGSTPTAVVVRARIDVKEWDGGMMLELAVSGVTQAIILATVKGTSHSYQLCGKASAPCVPFTASPGEHAFELSWTSTRLAVRLDCEPARELSVQNAIPKEEGVHITFGRYDGDPIDGTIRDVSVDVR